MSKRSKREEREDERDRKRREKFLAKQAALQAELDQLKEGNRRLAALQPYIERLHEMMAEHGASPIRSYCVYLIAYKQVMAVHNYREVMPVMQPKIDTALASMDAWNPHQAEDWASNWVRGRDDALAGKPPESPPAGFPAELL